MTASPPDKDNVVNDDGIDIAVDDCRGGILPPATADNDDNINTKEMSLIAHIEELRWTLIRSFCAIIICAIPCGIYWRRIFELIAIYPLHMSDPKPQIIYTAPTEAVVLSIKIALTCGVVIASPFIFFQIWRFISPALYKKEKRVILPAAIASTFCFLAGIAFCYYMLPMVLKFLTGFAGGDIDPMFKIDEYLGFLIKMSLTFGLAFELPVVAFVLSKMGVIDHKFMYKYFRHSIVLIFIAAAILTPPDVLSQILLATPLVGLYALSILISYMARPQSKRMDDNHPSTHTNNDTGRGDRPGRPLPENEQ